MLLYVIAGLPVILGKGEKVNGTGVITISRGASVTIEHCTLDGSNSTHAGIWYSGEKLIALANNIFGTNDGIFAWMLITLLSKTIISTT